MLLHGLEHHDHDEEHHSDEHEEEDHSDDHEEEEEDHHDDHDDEHEEDELNGPMVGLSIIAGIIFMMLIHSFGPGHSHGHGHGGKNANSKPRTGTQIVEVEVVSIGETNEDAMETNESKEIIPLKKQTVVPVTIGLLTHAIFDGVALGIV